MSQQTPQHGIQSPTLQRQEATLHRQEAWWIQKVYRPPTLYRQEATLHEEASAHDKEAHTQRVIGEETRQDASVDK